MCCTCTCNYMYTCTEIQSTSCSVNYSVCFNLLQSTSQAFPPGYFIGTGSHVLPSDMHLDPVQPVHPYIGNPARGAGWPHATDIWHQGIVIEPVPWRTLRGLQQIKGIGVLQLCTRLAPALVHPSRTTFTDPSSAHQCRTLRLLQRQSRGAGRHESQRCCLHPHYPVYCHLPGDHPRSLSRHIPFRL